MTGWGYNAFRNELAERLTRAESGIATDSLLFDDGEDAWVARPSDGRSAPPGFLQGRRLVVDVADAGFAVYPLGWAGRFSIRAGWNLGEHESTRSAERTIYGAGRVDTAGPGWRIRAQVSPTLPVLELRLLEGDPKGAWATVDSEDVALPAGGLWTRPASFEQDPLIERNNSEIPDPRPLPTAPAGLLLSAAGDRITIVAAGTEAEAATILRSWEDRRESELSYWGDVGNRLMVSTPDAPLTRQLRYSVHNSLFSRSQDAAGRDIFVHGRRDRGYADTAHLHQSYQMHLPALAAGEDRSVRDELLSFCALQEPTGWIERAPRPVHGDSLYVGRYTGAHLLLAAARYWAWTGDASLFGERVESAFDSVPRTVAERVDLAADDLVGHAFRGLIAPCGWADAWNPEVRAQGQISAAAILGLRAWGEAVRVLGRPERAAELQASADRISQRMQEILLDPETGLVAEHLFDDGPRGGTADDYWVHTQVWAALAGVTSDGRGLDRSRDDCLSLGMSIAPESAFDQEYVAESTDSLAALPLDSTATWLMAKWPEVTHLYALAELDRDDPDAALRAVHSQLPEALHALAPECAPWYYAEKYLYPGTRPWLCTWAGDPSLVEVVLTGFLGVHASAEGLSISPSLPAAWVGATARADFIWRGVPHTLLLDPGVPAGSVEEEGRLSPFGTLLPPASPRSGRRVLRASSAQSIANTPIAS